MIFWDHRATPRTILCTVWVSSHELTRRNLYTVLYIEYHSNQEHDEDTKSRALQSCANSDTFFQDVIGFLATVYSIYLRVSSYLILSHLYKL